MPRRQIRVSRLPLIYPTRKRRVDEGPRQMHWSFCGGDRRWPDRLGGAELPLPYLVGVVSLTPHQAVPVNLAVSLFTLLAIAVRLITLQAVDGCCFWKLIPALRASIKLPSPRPSRGRFMRRREAGRGAAPAGLVATRHSGGIGAPPGTTRSPCQELADSRKRTPSRLVEGKRGPLPIDAAK